MKKNSPSNKDKINTPKESPNKRKKEDKELDKTLKDTFPASDPITKY